MEYLKVYNQLCNSRKELEEDRLILKENGQYFERHHIKPRCTGGSDDDSNLVYLTSREHFIAHALLYRVAIKSLGGKPKRDLIYGFSCMKASSSTHENRYFNSRLYESIRVHLSTLDRSDIGKKISKSLMGRVVTQETREKLANYARNQYPHPMLGKKHSVESKIKMRKSRLGKKHSAETKRKISIISRNMTKETKEKLSRKAIEYHKNMTPEEKIIFFNKLKESKKNISQETRQKLRDANIGKKHSSDSKEKMSLAAKNREKVTCPHCGKEIQKCQAKRWHFDNCKFKKELV